MARIKDVARRAGVSSATVSRVLAGKPHVRPELRERVWKAVEELGYQPNRVARSLRAQQSKIIGLVISDIQNPFFTSVVRAVEDAAYERGFSVFLCNTDEDPEKEKMYLDLMRAERVAGIIVSPTREAGTPFQSVLDDDIPVVTLDRRALDVETDAVLIDNVGATYNIVSHLIADGHRRIGAVIGTSDITTGRERMAGFARALTAHGIEMLPELVIQVLPKEQQGFEATERLLDLSNPPTAIFTGNNLLTIGALKSIHSRNLTIPDDIALAGFDEMRWSSLISPGLTVVEQPTYELGQAAADLLLKRIDDPSRSIHEVILNARLIVRQSCAHHNDSM
ncbi:MAG: LacI family transcriptional regulator [Chloroflexi bacterium]|nr:MAG: LacI family transcriptional regulator [Chloroflexota bacterium]